MADNVRTQTLVNGSKNVAIYCTNVSDGTGESAAVKVDASAIDATNPKIMRVRGCCVGMSVDLYFDATANDLALALPADQPFDFDFTSIGGLQNPASTGVTGDILATTTGHTSADTYAFVIEVSKT